MKIDQLLAGFTTRGVTQAALRAGSAMQLQMDGQWQPQNANLTDENLGALIEEALDPAARGAWNQPEGRAAFERQGFSIAARKTGGAVQVLIKPIAPSMVSSTVPAGIAAPLQTMAPAPSGDWYAIEEGAEKGPYPLQKMQMMISMGTLGAGTLVWRDGLENWLPLQSTELARHLPAAPTMPPIAAPDGSVFQPRAGGRGDLNTSGSGEGAIVPPEVGSWNWGAFFFPLFWGHAHNQSGRAWAIFLTGFIPFIGGIISLILNVMMASQGNSLAWKHRRWDSVEHLKKTQKVWFLWGMGFLALSVVFGLIAVLAGN